MRPPITIGMPVYNGAAYIDQALAGLVEQTYRNFTLHVSDNASEDETWKILEKWAARDDRIVLHRQATNIGMVANFRYVLDLAETEYFMWHGYDDWLAPNYLEELLRVLSTDSACALACPVTKVMEPDGTPSGKEAFLPPMAGSGLARIRQQLAQPNAMRICGLFRTETLRRTQAFAQEFGQVMSWDHLMLLPLTLDDQVRATTRTTFYYRRGSESGLLYRPRTLGQRLNFLNRYAIFHLRALRQSRLTLAEKLLLLPWMLVYAVRSQVSHPLRRFVKRPLKRILKAVLQRPARAL